jgi:hypothetical protein
MAAIKSQGSYFGVFLAGGTVLCAGIAYIAGGTGKLLLLLGAVILVASAVGFYKIKHLEGETPVLPSPEIMKWAGAGVALLGWLVTIGGVQVVTSNGGRIVVALVGIGLSLFGILYVLPAAFNKNAFWKKPSGASARAGVTTLAGRATLESELGTASTAMGMTK